MMHEQSLIRELKKKWLQSVMPRWNIEELVYKPVHTVDTKTVPPALRQAVTAISTTNTQCAIFRWDSFNIKVHIVSMPSRFVSVVTMYMTVRTT